MSAQSQGRKPTVSIIVAMARNRVIGINNALPWHLSADLKRFKALTMGHHIIMGRKTFESIGRVLPGRIMLVVSANPAYSAPGATVCASLVEALRAAASDSEVFVIGGERLFREALPMADRVYLTQIEQDFRGDTYFPQFDRNAWHTIQSEHHVDPNGLRYRHEVLERLATGRA